MKIINERKATIKFFVIVSILQIILAVVDLVFYSFEFIDSNGAVSIILAIAANQLLVLIYLMFRARIIHHNQKVEDEILEDVFIEE